MKFDVKGLLVGICTAFALSAPAFAADDIIDHLEEVATPPAVIAQLRDLKSQVSTRSLSLGGISMDGIDLATIINLGEDVWNIIQSNKPVADISYDYATALPAGVTSASQLAGFSDLQYKSFRMHGTLLGITVYDVTYTLVHQFGGSLNGKGQYLATVAIIPTNVKVDWGYKLDMKVTNASTTNVGTADDPVGSVDMELSFSVHTIFHERRTTALYEFRGDTADIIDNSDNS